MNKTEINKIKELEADGFDSSFTIKDGKLLDLKNKSTYSHSQVEILDQFRYEGMSNPDDLSILFTFKTSDNKKGYVLAPFGPTGEHETIWFFNKVEQISKN